MPGQFDPVPEYNTISQEFWYHAWDLAYAGNRTWSLCWRTS